MFRVENVLLDLTIEIYNELRLFVNIQTGLGKLWPKSVILKKLLPLNTENCNLLVTVLCQTPQIFTCFPIHI